MFTLNTQPKPTRTPSLFRLLALLALALFFSAVPLGAQCVQGADQNGNISFTLYAGQNIDAGEVTATVDATHLYVTYETSDGWTLSETHLWVGTSLEDVPQNSQGVPVPGQFPYKMESGLNTTRFMFTIPLATLGFACPTSEPTTFYMFAHAAIERVGEETTASETAWSSGDTLDISRWVYYSTFTLTCDCGNGETEVACETAFARLSNTHTCFIDMGLKEKRWGWTNGPLDPGYYSMDLYAGAGQCDIDKGEFVGELTLRIVDGQATVTYTTTGEWFMQETHLYLGTQTLPWVLQGKRYVPTLAPGQFPYTHGTLEEGVTKDEFEIHLTGTPVYLIGHAVVCKEVPVTE